MKTYSQVNEKLIQMPGEKETVQTTKLVPDINSTGHEGTLVLPYRSRLLGRKQYHCTKSPFSLEIQLNSLLLKLSKYFFRKEVFFLIKRIE